MSKDDIGHITSSGNIYKDLGFADAEERLIRAKYKIQELKEKIKNERKSDKNCKYSCTRINSCDSSENT